MIGVIGGTGTVGRLLVEQLLLAGCRPTLLMRNPGNLPAAWASSGLHARTFDLGNPSANPAVLHGLDRLFVLANPRAEGAHTEVTLSKFASQQELKAVVRISVLGADPRSSSAARRWHGEAEEAWRNSLTPTVSIRANFFMQSLLKLAPSIAKRNSFSLPSKVGRVSFVDARDVADMATEMLVADQIEEGPRSITGPNALTFAEVAELIAASTGRAIGYAAIEQSVFIERLVRTADMKASQAALLAGIYLDIEQGLNSKVFKRDGLLETGRPRNLADFIAEHSHVFAVLASDSVACR